MIVVVAVFDAKEPPEAFKKLAQRTMTASAAEKGCVVYRFTADLDVANRFVLTEIWEDEAALMGHFGGEAFTQFMAEMPVKAGIVSHVALQGTMTPYTPPG